MPEPFTLHVPDASIADLKGRLARTRLADAPPLDDLADDPWALGTSRDALARLLAYWQEGFDWRAAEAKLNAFPQFKTPMDGIDLHYLHVPGQGPAPCPLLLSHGWPGSVFEFMEIIPRLTDPARFGGDPADAFTVVAPSLPGYGLSFTPGQRRFGIEPITDMLVRLMQDVLGYRRFAAQGGDWGASIAGRIGALHAEKVIGVHLNLLMIRRDASIFPTVLDAEQTRFKAELEHWTREETGYQWIQGTRPQTLAYGLVDSPAGLAAWILEKFRQWSDCGGDPFSVHSMDSLLANIGLYWFTGCIGASFHPYYARMRGDWPIPGTVTAPTGYAQFPTEIIRPPRSIAERIFTNIQRWTVMEKGGHFAAMEQPDALAQEIREFFRPLRAAL
jgi:pimeloyl-ACP methyl ester carboxylesterase